MPLDRLVLAIKALNYDRPAARVCAALIEPPSPEAVKRSIQDLVDLEALSLTSAIVGSDGADGEKREAREEGEELTALGLHLSRYARPGAPTRHAHTAISRVLRTVHMRTHTRTHALPHTHTHATQAAGRCAHRQAHSAGRHLQLHQ